MHIYLLTYLLTYLLLTNLLVVIMDQVIITSIDEKILLLI